MRFGKAGVEAHGPAQVLDGFLAPPKLVAGQAQVMQRIHMLGILGQNLPIEVLGLMNLPRALILEGRLEDLGNRGHLSRTFLASVEGIVG